MSIATRALLAALVFASGCSAPGPAAPSEPVVPALHAEPVPLVLPSHAVPMPALDLLTDARDDGSLVAGLHNADPAVRALAARALGRLPPPPAVDPAGDADAAPEAGDVDGALRARAADETDENVLLELIFALGQHAAAPAGDFLAARLEQGPPRVRAAAAAALGRLADDHRTPALVARLRDEDAGVRGAAALALFRLDGRRYTHGRTADEATLLARDTALADVALHDPDAGVRWRAVYAMAGVRGRPGLPTALVLCLKDDEPLCRVFAVRGLLSLQRDGIPATYDVGRLLADGDERVAIEAARSLALGGPLQSLIDLAARHPSALVRLAGVESLAARIAPPADAAPAQELDAEALAAGNTALADVAEHDASPMVRRQAAAALIGGRDPWRAAYFLHLLSAATDPRDRAAAATALQTAHVEDDGTIEALLGDAAPGVRAAALRVPGLAPALRRQRLVEALVTHDAGLRAEAADAVQAAVLAGEEAPDIVQAAAAALGDSDGVELTEARQALRKAFGLPPEDIAPAVRPPGRLLDRLLAEQQQALADPAPRVLVATSRGDFELELARADAPRHVQNFLELAAAGCYDGLDLHRVVPNFVVQGLDPRGDGYGTGGRRVPDEVNRLPYLTGTLGMPNAGPGTGGCQVFFTHVPAPHLDGGYTVFGRVVAGQDVVQRLEIGDTVTSVRRNDGR